jgi:hypothetical protein
MIVSPDPSRLAPADKAAILYAQARGDVSSRLWRAALGTDSSDDGDASRSSAAQCTDFSLDSLIALLMPQTGPAPATATASASASVSAAVPVPVAVRADTDAGGDAPPVPVPLAASATRAGLGANARYGDVLDAAAARTGIPAAALAAIVDAEASKDCDGAWKTGSRNPRSSAAGLGQFLGSTWQGEAERSGTWLHDVASRNGWLGDNGRVLPAAHSALLALRYDPAASIQATADYAQRSVAQLKRAGITIDSDVATVARVAYLGHHLGTGDAIRFLKGGLDSGRAKVLLDAQVGTSAASQRIAHSGDAASAHRSWLLGYIDRHITPARFVS